MRRGGESEGRCPLCNKVMMDYARNLISDNKRYNFPFKFYFCDVHGIYVWRGNRHELFDLEKRMNQAVSVEPLEQEIVKRIGEKHMSRLSDYRPAQMSCRYCGGRWKQHVKPVTMQMGKITCPHCRAEL